MIRYQVLGARTALGEDDSQGLSMISSEFRRYHTAEQVSGYDNAPLAHNARPVEPEPSSTSAPRVHATHEPEPAPQPAVDEEEEELPDYGELVAGNSTSATAPPDPSAPNSAAQNSADEAPRSNSFINNVEPANLQPDVDVHANQSGISAQPASTTLEDFGPSR